MNTIKLKNNVEQNGLIYLHGGKEYLIANTETSKNKGKIILVIESEIDNEDILIEVNEDN